MHLRFGKSIASGVSRPSTVSTKESWVQARTPLGPIAEESSSLSTSTFSADESSNTMGDSGSRGNQGSQPGPPQGGKNVGHKGATRLCLIGQNLQGAYLYMDPSSKIAVMMEDILSPLETKVWVTFSKGTTRSKRETKIKRKIQRKKSWQRYQ